MEQNDNGIIIFVVVVVVVVSLSMANFRFRADEKLQLNRKEDVTMQNCVREKSKQRAKSTACKAQIEQKTI